MNSWGNKNGKTLIDTIKDNNLTDVTDETINEITPNIEENYIEKFQRDGFLIIPNVLDSDECKKMRDIINNLDDLQPNRRKKSGRHIVHKTLFEQYPEECLKIFKNDKVLPICENLLSMSGSSRVDDRCLKTHVIHNNAFKIPIGGRGQAPSWHTDDAPLFSGELPPNVNISPIVLTCMYYLNDVRGEIDGMTHVIPGSHRLGRPCTNEEASQMDFICPHVSQGSVLIISSAIWHKGCSVAPNGNERYLFQTTYGRRLVGHKFKSIMDYHLPPKVKSMLVNDEDKELMGFLEGGAYSLKIENFNCYMYFYLLLCQNNK